MGRLNTAIRKRQPGLPSHRTNNTSERLRIRKCARNVSDIFYPNKENMTQSLMP